MTGVSLAKEILAIRPELPVMSCSGYSADVDARRAIELGFCGFYEKPVEFQKLVAQVADLLDA